MTRLSWADFTAVLFGRWKDEAEERAAIHEYDAGMSRDDAEQLTIEEMTRTQRKESIK